MGLFERQLYYEREGYKAAYDGTRGRENCPYTEGTMEWNFWVYGNDNATMGNCIHADGRPVYVSTDKDDHGPEKYFVRYKIDGRVTDQDGNPAVKGPDGKYTTIPLSST